jgi:hypothetical protein
MPSRAHQKGVKRTAREHDNEGWNVRADLNGWSNPPVIAGRQPDVLATKRGSRRIIEIETEVNAHQDQHATFRRHAGQKTNTVFIGYIVDSMGRRIEQFE